jgi:sec-independent protein translocase protein TatC
MSLVPEPRRGAAAPEAVEELPRMSLLQHLEELRHRLIRIVIALGIAVAVCLNWAPEICRFLARPIYRYLPAGSKLAFLGITDPFMIYFKTALIAGTFLACPAILWQLWRFVAPGLYQRERRWIGPFVMLGWIFFLGGGAFAYYVAFPFTVAFLLDLGSDFQAVITADRYYSLLLTISLGLGAMFELPLGLTLAARVRLVTWRGLLRNFRWAVLVIFVVAAVMTPTTDIVNLCLFAVPTVGLYLLGVAGAAIAAPKPAETTTETEG